MSKAEDRLRRAADPGHAEAMVTLGRLLEDAGQFEEARTWLLRNDAMARVAALAPPGSESDRSRRPVAIRFWATPLRRGTGGAFLRPGRLAALARGWTGRLGRGDWSVRRPTVTAPRPVCPHSPVGPWCSRIPSRRKVVRRS
ncbi:hypothetical protein [Nocardiopsis sp. SBT366]|uniref:hypothetical protein n=1 Tax=Nocardiopsis sp. SBT366 TaxID=1580529 RepID=UPI00350F1C27